jgi:hypothetical protein
MEGNNWKAGKKMGKNLKLPSNLAYVQINP